MSLEYRKEILSKAEQLERKNNLPEALNYYNKYLLLDADNLFVKNKILMIKQIISYQNTDIYASTNLTMDPWFEN